MYDDSLWASISLASKLRALDIRGYMYSMKRAQQLTKLTELRHLRLDSWSGFGEVDTANLGSVYKSLRKLESVSLTNVWCACPNSGISRSPIE